ncbi:hypothetical protein KY316_02035 [Candidatus Woesearchaeota archaeon]|nr:hypothetical protein [Candidatus Woesearchaeota archaeon]
MQKKLKAWKTSLLFFDIAVVLLGFSMFGMFTADIIALFALVLVFPYIYFTRRPELFKYLRIAFIVSLVWQVMTIDYYNYTQGNLMVFGISVFALLARTLAFLFVYNFYSHAESLIKKPVLWKKLLLFTVIYEPLMIAAESLAYNFFNVQLASSYPGLAFCNCLHVPVWMIIGYMVQAPLFFLICMLLKFKNPFN